MILILIIAVLFCSSWSLNLPENITHYATSLHHICLHSLPTTVENRGSLEALVCGQNIQETQVKELLIQSSLIHIFVVSGSHFLILRKILARIPILRTCPFPLLFLYALVTLCQPPSVRALLFLGLTQISESKKIFISPVILVFLSTIFTLALFPDWMKSRSLLMSTMAALVLAFMSEYWGKEKDTMPALFLTQSALYFFMGFCLWGFSSLHPLSILMNVVFGPLVGGLLFPLGIFVSLVPWAAFLFDAAVGSLFWILEKSSEVLAWDARTSPLNLFCQWCVFLTLLFFTHHFLVFIKRRRARDA